MKQASTLLLKGVIILIGLAVLAFCFFAIPRIIGSFDIGGYDPILLGLYLPAIPFFFALYQALKLLSYIDKNQAFSQMSVNTLKNIKYCAFIIAALFTAGMPFIARVAELDDAPGVVLIALIIIFASIVTATFSGLLQKLIQNAVDIKSENDLTV